MKIESLSQNTDFRIIVVFMFNVPPKVIWRQGHDLKSHLKDW